MPKIEIVKKVWGREHWIVNVDYCGKLLQLKKMHRCSMHHHKKKTETFYLIKGKVLLKISDKTYMMLPGDTITVYAGQAHRFTGIENSDMIEFSSHHDDEDSYRTTKSEKLGKDKISEVNEIISRTEHNKGGLSMVLR